MAGQGGTIGGILGGVAGTIIAPGIGTGIGATLGSGIGQFVDSSISANKGSSSEPPLVDVNRVRALEEARRKQRNIEAGNDAATQANLRQNDQAMSATQRAISKNTGGDVSGTVAGLLQSQRMGETNNNQIFANNVPRQDYFNSLQNDISKEISSRTFDLLKYKMAQKKAEEAQFSKEGYQNLMGGIGQVPTEGMDGGNGISGLLKNIPKMNFGGSTPSDGNIGDLGNTVDELPQLAEMAATVA